MRGSPEADNGPVARRLLPGLALLALAAMLTACGVRSTVDPVAAAATKTQDSGGYKTTMSVTVTTGGRELTMTGHGSFASDRGELEMDLGDALSQAGAPSGIDGTMKAIYITENGDPVMYIDLGFLGNLMPNGKHWLRIDLAQAGKAAGIDFGQLMGNANQNPADALALLRANGSFTSVGTETLGGVSTTHYHGTVDLAKAAEAKGVSADAVKRLLDAGAPAEYPIDVWVDDSGYVRQYRTSYDQTLGGRSMGMSMTIGMSDYGSSVDVSAPPAAEVFDATGLASQGAAAALSGTTH